MRFSILIAKKLLERDWDVSDGESMRGEFRVNSVRATFISKNPPRILLEFVGEGDKTVASVVFSYDEFKQVLINILDELYFQVR